MTPNDVSVTRATFFIQGFSDVECCLLVWWGLVQRCAWNNFSARSNPNFIGVDIFWISAPSPLHISKGNTSWTQFCLPTINFLMAEASKNGMFRLTGFCRTLAHRKTWHSVLSYKTESVVVSLQHATIPVDLLVCDANSILYRIATGYPSVCPLGVLSWETVALVVLLGVRSF